MKILYKYSDNHILCLIITTDLLKKVSKWSKNRNPDEKRLPYIAEVISRRGFVEGPIYIAKIKGTEKFECYDGLHRFTALNIAKNKPSEVLVDLMQDVTEDEVICRFRELNSSIPVPELYITNDAENKESCEKLIEKICNEWKEHKSHSAKPNRPNFNRDMLLDKIYQHFKGKHLDVNDFWEKMMKLNEEDGKYFNSGKKIPKKYPPKMLEKCITSGCYIFLKDDFLQRI